MQSVHHGGQMKASKAKKASEISEQLKNDTEAKYNKCVEYYSKVNAAQTDIKEELANKEQNLSAKSKRLLKLRLKFSETLKNFNEEGENSLPNLKLEQDKKEFEDSVNKLQISRLQVDDFFAQSDDLNLKMKLENVKKLIEEHKAIEMELKQKLEIERTSWTPIERNPNLAKVIRHIPVELKSLEEDYAEIVKQTQKILKQEQEVMKKIAYLK